MCPPPRLRHNLLDNLHCQQILCRNFHRFGGLVCFGSILPQYRSCPIRRYYGVNGVLQHDYSVPNAQRERPAAATFTDNYANDWYAQHGHIAKITSYRFRLSSLLSGYTRIGPLRVDKSNDRALKFIGLLHKAQRLAESFRMRTSKETSYVVLRILTPLLPHYSNRNAI
ncbi:hypothetical protein D3C77_420960 [compost metagenome]